MVLGTDMASVAKMTRNMEDHRTQVGDAFQEFLHGMGLDTKSTGTTEAARQRLTRDRRLVEHALDAALSGLARAYHAGDAGLHFAKIGFQ